MKNETANLPRRALATGLAACAHLLVLLLLGWKIPRLAVAVPAEERASAIELTLLRPVRPRSRASAKPARPAMAPSPAPKVLTAPAQPNAAPNAAPTMTAPAAPGAATATGPADCEPEDLPLLTEAEKARCRNQVDADKDRRMARDADGRLAREVARLKAVPRIDIMPAEKRAYYDAVAQAYDQQTHGPPMAGRLPGPACGLRFLGKKPATPPHSLKLGPLPCVILPPQGFLTEESGIAPP